jgi:hypothetical protein
VQRAAQSSRSLPIVVKEKMNAFSVSKAIVGAAIGVAMLAFSAVSASAEIVCNNESVCWHTHNPYDYPPEAHVTVHDNNWRWSQNEHYTFREHAGRGYWSGDQWIGW